MNRLKRMAGRLWRKPVTVAMFLAGVVLIWKVAGVQKWDYRIWAALFFLCLDAREDDSGTPWLNFLPMGLAVMFGAWYIYGHAADLWWKVADWQMTSIRHYFHWDQIFARIPLNDPGFLSRRFPSEWLTDKLRWVYNFGFGFCIWGSVIRSYLTRDWRKMLHYLLATHLLQTPLIVPFYNTVELHEVWWVLKRPDALLRTSWMDSYHLMLNAQNCFPSMHTSIAFAVILLAQRERGPIFKWGMTAYCATIIFSTLYLDIHWTIDVLAGLAFGYGVVKLADWVMKKLNQRVPVRPPAVAQA